MFRYWRELLRSSALILLFSVLFFGIAGVSALGEDVIEDVNKQGLDKLLADHDFVAVLFCKFAVSNASLFTMTLEINRM